jgi:hypothetical protein
MNKTEPTIAGERTQGHPESICSDCGGANVVWFTANTLWNDIVRKPMKPDPMLCPNCFIRRAEESGIQAVWEIQRIGAVPTKNQPPDQQSPPVDNRHVAEGCEQFGDGKTHSEPVMAEEWNNDAVTCAAWILQFDKNNTDEPASHRKTVARRVLEIYNQARSKEQTSSESENQTRVKWHTRMSSEGESGNALSVFSDIYKGDELVVSRIPFQQAEKWVERCNQEAQEADGQYKGKTAKEWFKLHEMMRKDFARVLSEKESEKQRAVADNYYELFEEIRTILSPLLPTDATEKEIIDKIKELVAFQVSGENEPTPPPYHETL